MTDDSEGITGGKKRKLRGKGKSSERSTGIIPVYRVRPKQQRDTDKRLIVPVDDDNVGHRGWVS